MKQILVACENSKIDPPLQRSLVHLAKSCQVVVVADGYGALNEIGLKSFDLIMLDSHLTDVNALDLAESIRYIDPTVPVILLAEDQSVNNQIHNRKIRVVERPIQPLSLLRLVDRLLHHQLNRYRDLANTLTNNLKRLRLETEALGTFLIEESGQPLLTNGSLMDSSIEILGGLIADNSKSLFCPDSAAQYHGLFSTIVLENLYLALLPNPNIHPKSVDQLWQKLDAEALDIIVTFHNYNQAIIPAQSLEHYFIPVNLDQIEFTAPSSEEVLEQLEDHLDEDYQDEEPLNEDAISINWSFLTENNVLQRLNSYCKLN